MSTKTLATVAVACYISYMTNTPDTEGRENMTDTLTETPEAPVKAKRTTKAKPVKRLPKLICKTKGCKNEVKRTGNRGRPPFNCVEHRNAVAAPAAPAAE